MSKKAFDIITATKDDNLFRSYLEDGVGDLTSWKNWFVCLRVIFGLMIKSQSSIDLVKRCTGRDATKLCLGKIFKTVLLLVGRRSGKSKVCGLIAAYIAALSGLEKRLSPGEKGLVSVISPTRFQSQIVKNYIKAALSSSPILEAEIVQEDRDGLELKNGVRIQILTGDFRSVRGFTQLAVVVDEICYFHLADFDKVRTDTELIRSIRPALATTGGFLIALSTKYAPRGWAYKTWKENYGDNVPNDSDILVWDAASKLMNPLLDQEIIDAAMKEDLQSAKSEFLNEWRSDVGIWLPREIIEAVVVKGRKELLYKTGIIYHAFCDCSGGRSDDAGLSIGHRDEKIKVIIDVIRKYKAPHSPVEIISLMSEDLKRFGLREIYGDNYAAQFVVDAFKSQGIRFIKSELNKSEIYLEMLPRICSGQVELLDDEVLVNQLASLERRTRSGGKDIVDHPKGAKDDVANAVSGVSGICSKRKTNVGVW